MGTEKCNSGWTEALTSQGVCQILNVTNNQAERNLNINLLFALNYTGRSFKVTKGQTRTFPVSSFIQIEHLVGMEGERD